MGTQSSSNRTALTISLVVVGVLIVLVIVAILIRKPPELPPPTTVAPQETLLARPALPTPTPPVATPAPSPAAQEVAEAIASPAGGPAAPAPSPTFDPEKQPRKLHIVDFQERASLPEGFNLDGVVLTDKGFQLPPPKAGEEDTPRFGTVESPSFSLDFPSNAVSPLWGEDQPEGTNVFIEVAVSPDNETWGIWHPIEPDDDVTDIPATFEDGRPNPNAGCKAGGVLFWGYRQYQYYKFRATLSSEAKQSPTLSKFHLFYQDSTLGQGHVAELQGDEIQGIAPQGSESQGGGTPK